MISMKMCAIVCCFILLAFNPCCESVECEQNVSTEEVHDPNSWYDVIAPMVPEGDEEMRGLLCDLDKVRPLVEEMANAKLDHEQPAKAEDEIAAVKSILMQKVNKGIRRISTSFKRVTDGLAEWPKLAQIYKSLRSGEFYRQIAAKNPKMVNIIPLMIDCSRGIRNFSSEKVPKLMGQMQNLIGQMAKVEGIDLAKVQPMEIGAKKGKNAISTVAKVLMGELFRGEKSGDIKDATGKQELWTVYRAWKTVIQNQQIAELLPQNSGINTNGNGHRRKKRMEIGLLAAIIAGAAVLLVILGILYYFFLEKLCKA